MEHRIKRMESAIIPSGRHGTAEPVEGKEEDESSTGKIESQAELSNRLSNLVVDSNGSPNFIGTSEPSSNVCMFVLTLSCRLGIWVLTLFSTRTEVDIGKSKQQGRAISTISHNVET
jgi:hypothetical protein